MSIVFSFAAVRSGCLWQRHPKPWCGSFLAWRRLAEAGASGVFIVLPLSNIVFPHLDTSIFGFMFNRRRLQNCSVFMLEKQPTLFILIYQIIVKEWIVTFYGSVRARHVYTCTETRIKVIIWQIIFLDFGFTIMFSILFLLTLYLMRGEAINASP